MWSRSGSDLFFRNGSGEMVAVQVQTSPTFAMGRTEVLFPARAYAHHGFHPEYDVALDGSRLLMTRPAEVDSHVGQYNQNFLGSNIPRSIQDGVRTVMALVDLGVQGA